MKTLVKTKVIRITETQYNTLLKMKSYNIDTGKFIRKEYYQKNKDNIKEYQKKYYEDKK